MWGIILTAGETAKGLGRLVFVWVFPGLSYPQLKSVDHTAIPIGLTMTTPNVRELIISSSAYINFVGVAYG